MSGGEDRRWRYAALLGLGPLIICPWLLSCRDRGAPAERCEQLAASDARNVCNGFVGAFDADATSPPSHLVFRSFCDGRERRVALPVGRGADVEATLVRAVDHAWRLGPPGGDCTFATELLRPKGDALDWGGVQIFDAYLAHRDGLAIERRPREVVTPLDFAAVRPDASIDELSKLPQIYRHILRRPDYLAPDTRVQPLSARGFVLRDGKVSAFRYHRSRARAASAAALVDAVHRAAAWFETMRDSDRGRFFYEYDPYADTYVGDEYNVLRHAGSTWALLQAYGLTGDERLRRLGEYGLKWLEAHSRTEERAGRTTRYPVAPWSQKAKLGGAGLWLLALTEHARLTQDHHDTAIIQQLANHIYLAQDPQTGQFASFHAADGLDAPDDDSDYYPGEAMFGLHRAQPYISGIPVCEVTRKGLGHMLAREPRELPADKYRFVNQWNVYAIGEYRSDCSDTQFDWLWRRDLAHMLAGAASLEESPVMAGAYRRADDTLSTSPTRLEALTTICTALGAEEPAIARRCDPVVRRVATMQLTYQHGPTNTWLWPNPAALDGAFGRGLDDERARIDFTQHHMSAMYNAVQFLREVSPRATPDRRAAREPTP